MSETPIIPVAPPPPPPKLVENVINKISILPKNITDYNDILNNSINVERNRGMFTLELFRIFHPVDSILQNGPTCGMTALAMALPDKCKTYKDLCDTAINNNWSRMGEMYSCDWMDQLASLAGAKTRIISNGVHNHLECMAECLRTGGFILVPYDNDKDFSPGLFGGAKAHWATIIGLLIFESSNPKSLTMSVHPCKCLCTPIVLNTNNFKLADCSSEIAINIADDNLSVSPEGSSSDSTEVVPYVVAMQGLSNLLKIWPLFSLAASNMNLKSEGDARKGQIIVPPEGIEFGLCGRAVLVWPN